jgi:hypothetical protein
MDSNMPDVLNTFNTSLGAKDAKLIWTIKLDTLFGTLDPKLSEA